jgi:hypothetical protein
VAQTLLEKAIKGDLRAITEVIDRAEGKPRQRIEQTEPERNPFPYDFDLPDTREGLERRIEEILAEHGNCIVHLPAAGQ